MLALFGVGAFGLIVGSFLNAVIYRLHVNRSIFEAHSICPHCKHQLSALDLVPVLSFLALRGRCRYCKKPISWQYPLVELATATAFLLIYLQLTTYNLFLFAFACFLIVIFVYDLKHYLILDKVVFPAAVLAAVYQYQQGRLDEAVIGALLLSGFFAFLYLISCGRYIGAGDIKLGIFLGLLVPFPETIALFLLAYFSGALVSLPLLFAKRKSMQDRLPFGTFLTFAAFISMVWGAELISWYFSLIGI